MTERKKLEKKLDDLTSKIIRRRDLQYGCITCGRHLIYETSTAGHFMHWRHLATRWSVVNVNGQCWKCNSKDDSKIYEEKMRRRYGDKTTDNIINAAHSNVKFTVSDLKEIYNELLEYQKNLSDHEIKD